MLAASTSTTPSRIVSRMRDWVRSVVALRAAFGHLGDVHDRADHAIQRLHRADAQLEIAQRAVLIREHLAEVARLAR